MGLAGYRRYALYWAPPSGSDLARLGAAWLGWDAEARKAVPQPDYPGIGEATERPRRYGFHGTLKPPFALAEGRTVEDLDRAARAFATAEPPATIPGLAIGSGLGFLSMRPGGDAPEIARLGCRVVEAFDGFRARPTEAELAKRRGMGLTAAQEAMLARWGYPYVFEEFRFHLTLSGPVEGLAAHRLETAARVHFAPAVAPGQAIREIVLFGDPGDGPFHILARYPLTGG